MKMRTLTPLTALALVSLSGCFLAGEGPSGESVTEFHTLTAFSGVTLLGVGDVTVVPGDDYTVTVTTDATFIDGVEVEVADSILLLNEDYDFETRDLEVSFLVTAPSIESAILAGAGSITVSGIDTEAFAVTLAGAGNMTLSGSASMIDVLLAGAGNVNTTELDASTIDVTLSGAGHVDVGEPDTLTVSLAGVGNVTYVGNPKVDATVGGVGSVAPR